VRISPKMADEASLITPAPSDAPVVPVTPPVTSSEPVQAVVTPGVPVVAPTPEAAPVAPVAPVEAVEAVVAPEVTPEPKTLLGTEPPKEIPEAPKAEGEPKAEEPKPTDGGQSDEPAPPPEVTFEPFTLPEGVTLKEDKFKEFTNVLADLERDGKADHAITQAMGQKLVDLHINELEKFGQDLTKYYQTAHEQQVASWRESFLSDPEIGGNRFQTTVDAAQTFIRTHGGTEDQQTEFRSLMESSGLGNHPAVIRLLANAQTAYQEGKPLAAVKPVQPPKSKITTMYGNS
jgi:hypothetical protein